MGLQGGSNGTIMRLGDGISVAVDRKEKPIPIANGMALHHPTTSLQDGPPQL